MVCLPQSSGVSSAVLPTPTGPGPVDIGGTNRRGRPRRTLFVTLTAAAIVVVAAALILMPRRPAIARRLPKSHPKEPPLRGVPCIVHAGDIMTVVLCRAGLSPAASGRVVAAMNAAGFNLKAMRPGDSITALYADTTLVRLHYARGREQVWRIDLEPAGCAVSMLLRDITFTPAAVSGMISNSLYEAVLGLGESPLLANELADAFGWEIDFFTEVQPGDSFAVLFLRRQIDSVPAGLGPLLAARYSGRVGSFDAFRFTDPDGRTDIYNSAGLSLRKQFLKSPLRFSRISSYFGGRRHPILRVRRQHHGLDYVAPAGTPVSAAADGRITQAGWSGGYGRVVDIAHAGGYTTRYGHLHGFARGIRAGAAVTQGDLIGYVGSTGLSTGPHLHYEVRRHGVPLNPMRLDPPREPPVAARFQAQFARTRDSLTRLLDRLR